MKSMAFNLRTVNFLFIITESKTNKFLSCPERFSSLFSKDNADFCQKWTLLLTRVGIFLCAHHKLSNLKLKSTWNSFTLRTILYAS